MTEPVNLIIDSDVGVDDALAVMLALSMPNITVVAITCVNGNIDLDKVCINTLKVLGVCDRLDVPVFRGAKSAFLANKINGIRYHGRDGMGDVEGIPQPDLNLIKKEVAAVALVRMVNERPGEISIAAIGPLTNVALAMKLDPNFTKKVKEIVIMGGDLEGKALAFLSSEFNFTCDPEAAHIVLSESQCPVLIMPYEVCVLHGFELEYFKDKTSQANKKSKFIENITADSLKLETSRTDVYTPWDFYAIACLADKSCVTRTERVNVQVELHGSLTRGKMIPDWNKKVKKDHDMNIIMSMDIDKIKMMLSKALDPM